MRGTNISPLKFVFLSLLLVLLVTNQAICQMDTDDQNCFSDDSDSHCVKSLDRIVKQDTLVFVTPWNKIGYELVQNFHNKVTMISPVWFYHEKNKRSGKFEFQGRQDIDREFVQKMRSRNAAIKILPRVYVSGNEEEFRWFLQESIYTNIFDQLAEIAEQEGLDGYVFDFPLLNRLKYSGPVKKMLDSIKIKFPKLYRVITFAGYRISLTKSIEQIEPFLAIFDKILVCTYDYPNKTFDKWLSPIAWFEENGQFYSEIADQLKVSRSRFILGLPFYGYIVDTNTYGARQIQIEEFSNLVNTREFEYFYKQPERECYWKNQKIYLFYPCIDFIRTRVDLINSFQMGAFVWDGGQGPYYFYHLL